MNIYLKDEYELEVYPDKYGEPPLIAKIAITDWDAGYEHGRYYIPPTMNGYAVTGGLSEDEIEQYKRQIEEGVQYIFDEAIQTLIEQEQ